MKTTILKISFAPILIFAITLGGCYNGTKNTTQKETTNYKPEETMKTSDKKYYELVLIWVKDPAKFEEYGAKVTPIVQKYGGGIDKMFAPSSIYAEDLEQPHIVNLVYYESKEAYTNFTNDPDFKAIEHLRNEGIDMISFRGYLNTNNPSFENLEERMYNIELANYKDGDKSTYKIYENEGEDKMKKYGFETEFVLDIDVQSSPLNGQLDFAKISFFKNEASMSDFEKDPAHKLIEEELYPNATENVIWISGKIHPMMLQMMGNEK